MPGIMRRVHLGGRETDEGAEPANLWVACPQCKELLIRTEHEELLRVCKKCKYHFRLGARQRIEVTLDEATFVQRDADMPAQDPLNFTAGSRSYRDKLTESETAVGSPEAFLYGSGTIEGLEIAIGAIDADFIAGSMGSGPWVRKLRGRWNSPSN